MYVGCDEVAGGPKFHPLEISMVFNKNDVRLMGLKFLGPQ
jgi:hypothetical protein